MKELIRITEQNGKQLVSAKELHRFLEVKTNLVVWCKRMFEYGFVENVDYTAIKSENPVNQQVGIVDYALILDCAKEISMIQRTEKGKIARTYFIEKEKELKQLTKLTPAQLFMKQAQINLEHEQKLSEHENRIQKLEQTTGKTKEQNNKLKRENDWFWDREDRRDLYR